MKKQLLLACLWFCCVCSIAAQDTTINPVLLQQPWAAGWISCPGVSLKAYGVFHFRKTFSLGQTPARFIIHLSADNRYRLWVNGRAVCAGPARGSLYNWYFETLDIAPYLQQGNNVLAVQVWNMAEYAAVAQVSNQTALVVQGDGETEKIVNTDRSWKVMQNKAYSPCSIDNGSRLHSYMVIGPGDRVNAALYPWGWEQAGYADTAWQQAQWVAAAFPAGVGTDNLWTLAPRTIPLMEESTQRIPLVRRAEGLPGTGAGSWGEKARTVPAHSHVTLLLDQTYNTVAYPELITSGGKGAVVQLTYAEALLNPQRQKGNRDSIEGKTIAGNYDIFEPDGGSHRLFRPLWFRTFRYLQLDITTGDQPLTIEDLYGRYTGYPFQQKARFSSSDTSLQQIWNVGWRTARLCAGETYFDCPYYEQLQYEADTRIQAFISLYVTGDDRLMRKAINDFYTSRVPEGLTQGRFPSNRLQVIPPFSLFWVSMLYDYWMLRRDNAFLQQYLMAARGVLDWYEKKMDHTMQMLGPMPWWNFVDWNTHFPNGTPDGATDGNSAVISLQYAYTLEQAAALFAYFGHTTEAAHYATLAKTIASGTYRHCFDKNRGLMANTPAKQTFSQHASIMGVLAHAVPAAQAPSVMQKVLTDTGISQATFYYRFYLTRALKQAGMAHLYYEQLQPWRDMLAMGLTTFAENPEPTRSDCHAWSASPNYDFLATLCGIEPDSAGFARIKIQPAPGALTTVQASMPHPDGTIQVSLQRKGRNGIQGVIDLPPHTTGRFIWHNKEIPLKAGSQQVRVE